MTKRRSKYNENEKEILEKVEYLASLGLLDKHIWPNLDISEGTYYDWLKNRPEFFKAIKRGRAKGIQEAAAKIKISDQIESKYFYLKCHGGWLESNHKANIKMRKEELELKKKELELRKQDLELKALIASKITPEEAFKYLHQQEQQEKEEAKK